ncbi:MAG: sugar phosphate nucleotidyltransferase [Micrococcales bacterium]|nr:sugar phosphate nucleotidyltransferase [Micrococcales bacterium]MCL2666214.1 sugar phosphate nucleotidyltransferase [Micrococcales bacterium]
MSGIEGFHAVIPAGGAGTRLWPLSRTGRPKFLVDMLGSGRTLLQGTVDRLLPLTGPDRLMVVTGRAHRDEVVRQVPELVDGELDQVLAEPSPRDSMAAIGLAAAVLAQRHGPETVLGSFAADHVVDNQDIFERTVAEAVAAAHAGYVVTVGIKAAGPSTAFGYIAEGDQLGVAGAPTARHVTTFTEKPDADTAWTYLATGRYCWNAGMFVVAAGVLLDHLHTQLPTLHDGLRQLAAAWDTPQRDAVLDAVWPTLTRIAIDHAIAEPVAANGGVAVIPGLFGWDDVGDFDSLAALLGAGDPDGPGGDPPRSATLGDDDLVLRIDADDAFVVTTGRAVTVVGLDEAVIVDTPDALLVTTRAHAQKVKTAVDAWRARGATSLL